MTKAPDAFRTISEVAAELDLPQHVLRFWESRFPQVKPMKRGGGRRYYRPDDVELLRGIRHLLYGQGYTIRGVQRIMREQGPRFVQIVWQDGAPQPEPAAEQDIGEGDAAEGDLGAAEATPVPHAIARAVPASEPEAPLPPESARQEPTFAPTVPGEGMEAVEAPIRYRGEGETRDDRPAAPPEREVGLSDADRARLSAALQELAECRRLLDEACADAEQIP